MDPAAPITPAVGPEDTTFLAPLIKRDLERLKYHTQNCSDRLEGCQRQIDGLARKFESVAEASEALSKSVCASITIALFFTVVWLFTHVKIGWA
jgi:hypothetical protein